MMMMRLSRIGLLVLVICCPGCMLALPHLDEKYTGHGLNIDRLCGNKDSLIRPGMSRSQVRSVLRYEGYDGVLGRQVETYSFLVHAGQYFWMGPNPEGGFIGVMPRNRSF